MQSAITNYDWNGSDNQFIEETFMKKKYGFLVVVLLCIIFFVVHWGYRVQVEKQIIADLEKENIGVIFDYEYDFLPEHNRIDGYSRPPRPSSISSFIIGRGRLNNVVYIQIAESSNRNALESVSPEIFPNLQHLFVVGEVFDEKTLLLIVKNKKLRSLDLSFFVIDENVKEEIFTFLPDCSVRIIPRSCPTVVLPSQNEEQSIQPDQN